MLVKDYISSLKFKRFSLVNICSIFFIISCTSISSQEILPLNEGNYWIMKTTRYDDNGDFKYSKFDTTSIIGDTIINEKKYFITGHSYNKSHKKLYINNENGLYIYSKQYLPNDLLFKYPGLVGDKFKNVGIDSMRIDSINTDIVIGLGKFTCYKYTITKEGLSEAYNGTEIILKENIYLSPDIGWIYYCSLKIFDDKIIMVEEKELIEYLIKKY